MIDTTSLLLLVGLLLGLLVFAKVQSTSMNWVKCVSLFSLEIRMVADTQILGLSV